MPPDQQSGLRQGGAEVAKKIRGVMFEENLKN